MYTCTVAHTIEPAASGRAKCRGCGEPITKGELRLGARLPNPFDGEKEMTLGFHLICGAYKRPEPFLEAANQTKEEIIDRAHPVGRLLNTFLDICRFDELSHGRSHTGIGLQHLGQGIGVNVTEVDAGAIGLEPLGDGAADALRAASNQNILRQAPSDR